MLLWLKSLFMSVYGMCVFGRAYVVAKRKGPVLVCSLTARKCVESQGATCSCLMFVFVRMATPSWLPDV